MTSMALTDAITVVGGIDTHKELHVAAVVDRDDGRLLDTKEFSTTRAGYRALLRWLTSYGQVHAVGIEGTGSYGAGVTRHLTDAGVRVYEVDRPDRSARSLSVGLGKGDTVVAVDEQPEPSREHLTRTPTSGVESRPHR